MAVPNLSERCVYQVQGICNKTYVLAIEAGKGRLINLVGGVDDSCLSEDLRDYQARASLSPEEAAQSRCPLVNTDESQIIYIRNIQVNPQPTASPTTSPIS